MSHTDTSKKRHTNNQSARKGETRTKNQITFNKGRRHTTHQKIYAFFNKLFFRVFRWGHVFYVEAQM